MRISLSISRGTESRVKDSSRTVKGVGSGFAVLRNRSIFLKTFTPE